MLEDWFEHYPGNKKVDLRQRFRADDAQHKSAFFELYIHQLLTRLGYDLQAEPDVSGCVTHPDFLAYRAGSPRFYLEATLAGLQSEKEYAAEKRKNTVYDLLNTIDSPNFFLAIDIEGDPSAPPTKKLRKELIRWLATMDPDVIGKLYESGRYADIPSYHWQTEGWILVFKPRPKSPELRGQPGIRPIGLRFPTELEWQNSSDGIRNAIEAKAKKYGQLDLPFVIAINVVEDHCDNVDIMNALYGDEITVMSQAPGGKLTESWQRTRNGAWIGKAGPRKTLVSAVLLGVDLHPWNVGAVSPELFQNPWASHPFSTADWPLPHCVADLKEGRVCRRPGASAGQFLGIPSPWPLPEDSGPARFLRHQRQSDADQGK
jgi:hypothetical protein